MCSKYKVIFLMSEGTELKSKESVRPEAAIWYSKVVPTGAKKIRIDNLLSKSSKIFNIDECGQYPKHIVQIKEFLGVIDE